MLPIVSLLVVLVVSHVAIRAGASALSLTGVADEAALFQAQSAFLGVGFTTHESEQILAHPVRRRIVMLLMTLGNAGVVASISSVVLVFLAGGERQTQLARVGLLVGAVVALWLLARRAWIDRGLTRLVRWALRRWTQLDVRDYVSLLHLANDFAIVELEVRPHTWLAGRTLAELDLRAEGVLVLGIDRGDDGYLGVPRGPSRLLVRDVLLVYGRAPLLADLDRRPAGAAGVAAHALAVDRQWHRLGLHERAASPATASR